MNNFLFIGIDPGQSGAIAVINSSDEVIALHDWPGDEIQAAVLVYNLTEDLPVKAAIEKVAARPKQGVSSMFKFGTNYGVWKGILAAFSIPFLEVTPQKWQKGIISKAQDKKPSIAAAGRLFPSAEITGPRGGAKDGRADALLIAYWCKRQFIGEHDEPKRSPRKTRRAGSNSIKE
jgi:Holliday junction resolvasome RuvABC endonuclease subunit